MANGALVEEALQQIDAVQTYSPRVKFGSMYSNFSETTAIRVNGVDPDREAATVPLLPGRITEGRKDGALVPVARAAYFRVAPSTDNCHVNSQICSVSAVLPRQNITSTVRHLIGKFRGGGSLGLLDWSLLRGRLLSRSAICRGFNSCSGIWNPAHKWCEVFDIHDVPSFFGGIPSGTQCFHCILFSERRY